MATKFKPQSPATIERNRARRVKRDAIFKAICLHHRPKVPKGTARAKARRNIPEWKERRAAKQKQQRGELPVMKKVMQAQDAE